MKTKVYLFIVLFSLVSISLFAKKIIVAKTGGNFTSVQLGLNSASAGDTVLVKAGTYNEAITFTKSGTANAYINLIGETGAILDGIGKGELGISITSFNYIRIIGMEVQNFKGTNTPIGISVNGSSSFLEVRNNKVHNIENSNEANNGNAHGIAFYGNVATPITNILVDGNEVRNCILGLSESMVFNGNVTNFIVSNNVVHDNDNIGIDFIGFEGTSKTGIDQARNGSCINNTVYNITSINNPTYGGETSADGIYVDGGMNIIIERNNVSNCDIGIELASEHLGKNTEEIIVRNNFVSGSLQANIMAGGYDAQRGNAINITIVNNTTYHGVLGELAIQFNCNNLNVKNNIFYGLSSQAYLQEWGSNNTAVTVNNNIYYGESTSSPGDFADAKAKYTNPKLVSAPTNMHLNAGSPAIDAGIALGNDASSNPLVGDLDIDNQLRIINGTVDLGADEFGSTIPTIIEEAENGNSEVNMFPNPAKDEITIRLNQLIGANASVVIYSVNGMELINLQLKDQESQIALDGLNSGIYFVKIVNNQLVEMRKLIKE